MVNKTNKILLAGASGYVGGRLANALTQKGYSLRCMVRRPKEAAYRLPSSVEIVQGDVLNPDSIAKATQEIDTAYYLVHSMGDSNEFESLERRGAENFAKSCENSGVKRIIYLGGLGQEDDPLSSHLRSRMQVGKILRNSQIEVIEFRASIVIGSGSLSFEMVRTLTEKLPVMITPKWVDVKAQPIGIEDLLAYLMLAAEQEPGASRVVEIGGKDVVSYKDLMKEYARQRGLARFFIPVPLLSPNLSSLWLGLVTPLYARIGHKLITSIKNPTLVTNPSEAAKFEVHPMGVQEAIRRALSREDQEFGDTHWSDAISSLGTTKSWAGIKFGNRIVDSRHEKTQEGVESLFSRIQVIGGETGWYFGNFLWSIRGFIDRLIGGPGLRRGRRHAYEVQVGDAIDFWRVEAFEPNKKIRLRAEMKLPGRAWLEFSVERKNGDTYIHQTAIFDPMGLSGLLYWYLLYPIHRVMFKGMLKSIVKAASQHQMEVKHA